MAGWLDQLLSMARKLRVEYAEAIYHVICRLVGSWREGDRELFRVSIGDSGFRDWVKIQYAELVKAARHPEDVSFRRAADVLDPEWVLDCLAGLMDCNKACFKSRNHGQPHRNFAACFLSRYAGLSRRDCAGYLGVTSGPAVSQLLTRYHRLLDTDRKLRRLAPVCDEALKVETKVK